MRSSADITVKEITDWAKTFKIPQAAVNELLQILKIKRVKMENNEARPPEANVLQQSRKKFLKLFLKFLEIFIFIFQPIFLPQKPSAFSQKSTNALIH